MNSPDSSKSARIKTLFDEIIEETLAFDWSKMANILELLKKARPEIIKLILNELKDRLKDDDEPYIHMYSLIILETITDRYKSIRQELTCNDILDGLLHLMKATRYENIRKKIVSLFHDWLYGSRKIPYGPSMIKVEKELKASSFIEVNNHKTNDEHEGNCFRCNKRKISIICAGCIQLMCRKCSQKTLTLPQYGFQGEVRICDVCIIFESHRSFQSDKTGASISTAGNENTSVPDDDGEASSSNKVQANAVLIQLMKCPICLIILRTPIIQCKTGHSMCKVCIIGKLTSCPICEQEITPSRNFIAESIVVNLTSNCIYDSSGCKAVVTLEEKQSHEKWCDLRRVLCEGQKFCEWPCNWVASFNQVEQHFSDFHKVIRLSKSDKTKAATFRINFHRDYCDVQFLNFRDGEKFFWYKLKVDPVKQQVYWIIQMIGSKEEAATYCYEIEISKDINYIESTKFREVCVNDLTDPTEYFDHEKCIVIPFKLLRKYMDEKNAFNCTLSIINVDVIPCIRIS